MSNASSSAQPELIVFSNNPTYSDIKFVVGADEPETAPTPTEYYGHKVLFAAKSAVFHAMFNSDIPVQDNEVRITDVEPRIFELFIKYIYNQDKPDLALDFGPIPYPDLIQLAYAATKYLVDDLVVKCSGLIIATLSKEGKDKLTAENALGCWQMMLAYIPATEAAKRVQMFVDKFAVEILKTKGFLQLDNSALTQFLASDSLNVPRELQLFSALVHWAKQKCLESTDPTSVNPMDLREQMGPALFQIRFPTMDFYSFRSIVRLHLVLTAKELSDILHFMYSSEDGAMPDGERSCHPFNTRCRPSTRDSLAVAKIIIVKANIFAAPPPTPITTGVKRSSGRPKCQPNNLRDSQALLGSHTLCPSFRNLRNSLWK